MLPRSVSSWVLEAKGETSQPPRNLSQCLTTLTIKKDFFNVYIEFHVFFSSCPLLFVLSLGTGEKSLVPFSSHPPIR